MYVKADQLSAINKAAVNTLSHIDWAARSQVEEEEEEEKEEEEEEGEGEGGKGLDRFKETNGKERQSTKETRERIFGALLIDPFVPN